MKLKLALMILFLVSLFSINTFAQTSDPSINKTWSVESYQGWKYVNNTNTFPDFSKNIGNFYFDNAYFWLNASTEHFDFQGSIQATADINNNFDVSNLKIGLYTANIKYHNSLTDKVNYSVKAGLFSNNWYTYTQGLFGNRTIDIPLNSKYSSFSYPYQTNQFGLDLGLQTEDFNVNATISKGDLKDSIMAGMLTAGYKYKNWNFGAVYNAKLFKGSINQVVQAISGKDSVVSLLGWYNTFGGAIDYNNSCLHSGGEFLYSNVKTMDNSSLNSYVGTAYVGYTPKQFKHWTLLLKGDYYVPNTNDTKTNNVNAQVNVIWHPVTFASFGLQYAYNWNNNDVVGLNGLVAKSQYYTLGIKTGINF